MVKHNNELPNRHFHKYWQARVKTWFNQPAKKKKRRLRRAEKAAKVFPRPADGLLRPVVRCETIKYNQKTRLGRGFTFLELKEAGINKHEALGIGIAVDHRRKNRSENSLRENVQRLKEYKARLVVFPRKGKKARKTDSSKEDCDNAGQVRLSEVMAPRTVGFRARARQISDKERKIDTYSQLRTARAQRKMVGLLEKKKREAEAEK